MIVVDLSRGIAGAYCAQLLALAGGDVLRLDLDGRDEHIEQVAWEAANRGKRERRVAGAAEILEQAAEAVALIEDRGPGGLEALGLDEAALRARNPKLVITRISDFGQDGPWAQWAGSDLVDLAASGMLFITGTWEKPPVQMAPYQTSMTSGVLGAVATTAAIFAEEGVTIDFAQQEAPMSFITLVLSQYAYNGRVASREGKVAAMTRIEVAKDDWVYAGPGAAANADYQTFSKFLEIPELAEPRFATPEGRMANWEEHQRLVLPVLKQRTTEEWLQRAEEWHLTFGPVHTMLELLQDDVLNDRDFFVDGSMPDPGVRAPKAPYLVDGVRPDALSRPMMQE